MCRCNVHIVCDVPGHHINGDRLYYSISAPNKAKRDLYQAFDSVFWVYNKRLLRIKEFNADQEFAFESDTLLDLGIDLVPVPIGKHEPHIERTIRTLKERYRSLFHKLPFNMMPKIMVVKAAQECARWVNSFPVKGGYPGMSPMTLTTGVELDFDVHCKYGFGSYV